MIECVNNPQNYLAEETSGNSSYKKETTIKITFPLQLPDLIHEGFARLKH